MQMSDNFRGALVVVVATAPSPSNSLLSVKPQPDQSHTWRTASLIRYKEMDLDAKFRKRLRKAHFGSDATYDTPISKRAWCFQENCLPVAVWSFAMMTWYGSVDPVAYVTAAESKNTLRSD